MADECTSSDAIVAILQPSALDHTDAADNDVLNDAMGVRR
jgi:hypothetical protein